MGQRPRIHPEMTLSDDRFTPVLEAHSRWLWVLAALVTAYFAIGFFPFGPVECDSVGVAVGSEHVSRYGWDGADLTYNYVATSGTHQLLIALANATGFDAFDLFSILSAAAALGFLALASIFLARLLRVPIPACALVLLTFQEIFGSGSYPNSNILASIPLMGALVLATRPANGSTLVWIGVLFGISGWIRADTALLGLAFAVLLYDRTSWLASIRQIATVGIVSLAVVVGAIYASGASLPWLFEVLSWTSEFDPMVVHLGSWEILYSFFVHGVFLMAAHLVLIPMGWILLGLHRHTGLLILSLAGVAPLWALYGPVLPSPKFLHYAIPFAAIPCVYLLRLAAMSRLPAQRWVVAGALLLLMGQGLVGLRVMHPEKPWGQLDGPGLFSIYRHEAPAGSLLSNASLEVGSGTVFPTVDGPRLTSGVFFAPLMWHQKKQERYEALRAIEAHLTDLEDPSYKIWTAHCFGGRVAQLALLRTGFECTEREVSDAGRQRTQWHRDDQRVALFLFPEPSHRGYTLDIYAEDGPTKGLYVAGSGREQRRVVSDAAEIHEEIAGLEDFTPIGAYEISIRGKNEP